MKRRRRARLHHMFIRLCLLGLFAFGSCRPVVERQVSGKLLSIEGSGQGKTGERTVSLTKNSWVKPGETILSVGDSRIDLMLLPGILVELSSDTEIEIKQLRLAKNGDETIRPMTARAATVRLIRGTLIASVGQAQTRSKLLVQTTAGTLTAGNLRTFRIEVIDDRTRIMSIRRRITFESIKGGPPTKLGAGDFAEWPANVAGVRSAAESGLEAQAAVSRILIAEKRLLRFEKAAQFGFE